MSYAEYHRMLGQWFATGTIDGRRVRQVAHELRSREQEISVRVYWTSGGCTEYAVPMTLQHPEGRKATWQTSAKSSSS